MQNEIVHIHLELRSLLQNIQKSQKKGKIKRERLPERELDCWQLKFMNLGGAKRLLFKQ